MNKIWIAVGLTGVALTFLFQDFSFLAKLGGSEEVHFILRKSVRVMLNDVFMLIFINAWFKDWQVTKLAIAIQIVDSLVLLPLYLVMKLQMEGTSEISSPLFSQFHRLIINPTLMILLVPAVYFQKISTGK